MDDQLTPLPAEATREMLPLLVEDLPGHSIVASSLLNNSAAAWIHAGTCTFRNHALSTRRMMMMVLTTLVCFCLPIVWTGEFAIAYQLLSHGVDDLVQREEVACSAQARRPPTIRTTMTTSSSAAFTTVGMLGSHDYNVSVPRLPFVSCPLHQPVCRDEEYRSFVLFDRPLIVETTLAVDRQTPELVQAAIHYNLALLYHVEGMNSGKSAYAQQADRLYAAANHAIDRAIERGATTPCEASLMLLAIWNNRAHVRCWCILDYFGADLLIQQMKEVLQQYTPGISIVTQDHRVFFLNVLIYGMAVGSAPAA
jgi:hypothetical protein